MANCYICGRNNATYKRTVHTGNSYSTTYSMRGNAYMSSSSHYGSRMVCAECALNIDYKAHCKPSGVYLFLIIFGFILLIGVPFSLIISNLMTKKIDMSLLVSSGVLGVLIYIALFIRAKENSESNGKKWYSANKSRYLGETTARLSDNKQQNTIRYDDDLEENWKCDKGNSTRYTYESLSTDKKEIIKKFTEKIFPLQSFDEIIRLQDVYFNTTTSLDFMRFILPDARKYEDINSYKADVEKIFRTDITTNSIEQNNDHNSNVTQTETKVASNNALQMVLDTISNRMQQEIKILETKQAYINELLKKTVLTTASACDKALNELDRCENEVEKSKKSVVKFCNDYIKQISEMSFEADAVTYAKNFIDKSKLGFTDFTNQFVNQLKSAENQILQAKIQTISE